MQSTNPRLASFWGKVERRGPDECWEWKAARLPTGYGQFWMHHYGPKPTVKDRGWGRMMGAHRAIWIMLHGEPPPGAEVCHRCDNRACVNPGHLWLGTHQENIADCHAKGRAYDRAGAKNPNAKLTPLAVAEIRTRFAAGESRAQLARDFGMCWEQVQNIVTGKQWKAA